MNDFALGPLVLSGDRLIWIIAALVLWASAAIANRGAQSDLSGWAFRASLVAAVTARVFYVLGNLSTFLEAPLSMLAFWQGGFSLLGGAIGFAAVMGHALWRHRPDALRIYAATAAALSALYIFSQLMAVSNRSLPEGLAFADLNGRQFELSGPAVINLWASWCPPCRREMPMMVDEARRSPDVPILFINQGESAEVIRSYLSREGLVMTPLLDPGQAAMSEFGTLGLPTTLFIAPDGRVQQHHSGEISRAALRQGSADLR